MGDGLFYLRELLLGLGCVSTWRQRAHSQVRWVWAGERLTFLGPRREEPWEERTEDDSSVMMGVVRTVQRVCKRGRASERSRRLLSRGSDGVHVGIDVGCT